MYPKVKGNCIICGGTRDVSGLLVLTVHIHLFLSELMKFTSGSVKALSRNSAKRFSS